MDSAERSRGPLEECRRLVPLAQSAPEATVLRSLARSGAMIANQTVRYAGILRTAARK
jgi:hypothetical protein